jgi:two-component system, cell cycle sensor histidine kinase PleC
MTSNTAVRVLVADDEEAILAEYRRIFAPEPEHAASSAARNLEAELFGDADANGESAFDLVTCRQGSEAVDAFRAAQQDGRPFSVVYLDVRMPPGPNGIETARAIRALDPQVHIAIITGYSDISPEKIAQMVQPVDRLFYFEKPFRGVELRQLATALAAKWSAERALVAARDDLERQVVERTAALALAKERAERASESKSRFLANMSHELRTPLNAVIGFSELILGETLGPVGHPRYGEYLQDISASGRHLLGVIEAILDMAKADHGTLVLREQPFMLDEAIDAVMLFVEPQALKAGVALHRRAAPAVGAIYADRTKVVQVLTNLATNAVKFTPAGGQVTIESRVSTDGGLVVSVADTGIGIKSEDIPRALEPFVQIDDGKDRAHEGTGLGLPLSVALVELHGGALKLESSPGAGTTVTVTFPAERTVRCQQDPDRRSA